MLFKWEDFQTISAVNYSLFLKSLKILEKSCGETVRKPTGLYCSFILAYLLKKEA